MKRENEGDRNGETRMQKRAEKLMINKIRLLKVVFSDFYGSWINVIKKKPIKEHINNRNYNIKIISTGVTGVFSWQTLVSLNDITFC